MSSAAATGEAGTGRSAARPSGEAGGGELSARAPRRPERARPEREERGGEREAALLLALTGLRLAPTEASAPKPSTEARPTDRGGLGVGPRAASHLALAPTLRAEPGAPPSLGRASPPDERATLRPRRPSAPDAGPAPSLERLVALAQPLPAPGAPIPSVLAPRAVAEPGAPTATFEAAALPGPPRPEPTRGEARLDERAPTVERAPLAPTSAGTASAPPPTEPAPLVHAVLPGEVPAAASDPALALELVRGGAHLTLELPGLGALELQVRVEGTTAHVAVERGGPIVERHLPALAEALTQRGLQLGELRVTHPERASAGSGHEPDHHHAPPEPHEPEPRASPRKPARATPSTSSAGLHVKA